MEICQLQAFRFVASFRSFSKAAAELHLTQPAVTQQIKHLETEIGELLFDRSGRNLSLTPAGEVFLTFANQILNLTEQAVETVRQYSDQKGRLTIAAGTTNTIFRLPQILQNYRKDHPQIEIQIRNGDSKLTTQLVYDNAVDLGLVTTINPKDNVLMVLPIFKDLIWLIGPPNYSSSIPIRDLEKESLILFRNGSGFRMFLEENFHRNNFTPKISMEMESIEAIIRLVQTGFGLAFLPEIAVREELAGNRLQKIEVKGWASMYRQTYLIYRRDKYLTWPVKAFLKQICG
jgi:DNA-binding transcriptional LysR family regulator